MRIPNFSLSLNTLGIFYFKPLLLGLLFYFKPRSSLASWPTKEGVKLPENQKKNVNICVNVFLHH